MWELLQQTAQLAPVWSCSSPQYRAHTGDLAIWEFADGFSNEDAKSAKQFLELIILMFLKKSHRQV